MWKQKIKATNPLQTVMKTLIGVYYTDHFSAKKNAENSENTEMQRPVFLYTEKAHKQLIRQ